MISRKAAWASLISRDRIIPKTVTDAVTVVCFFAWLFPYTVASPHCCCTYLSDFFSNCQIFPWLAEFSLGTICVWEKKKISPREKWKKTRILFWGTNISLNEINGWKKRSWHTRERGQARTQWGEKSKLVCLGHLLDIAPVMCLWYERKEKLSFEPPMSPGCQRLFPPCHQTPVVCLFALSHQCNLMRGRTCMQSKEERERGELNSLQLGFWRPQQKGEKRGKVRIEGDWGQVSFCK